MRCRGSYARAIFRLVPRVRHLTVDGLSLEAQMIKFSISREELLEDADVDTQQTGNTWEQTLRYKAKVGSKMFLACYKCSRHRQISTNNINPFQAEHHDLNLTCKVAHIGFEDGDVTSASALVNLTPEFVKMLAEGSEDGLNADASVSKQPKSVRRALIIC